MPTPHPYTLTTPLPAGALRFHELSHSAGLSQLEETRLNLLSDKPDLAPDELLGQPMGLAIEMRDGAQRHIGGYVTRFGLGQHQGRYFGYEAVVRPWLWFLTRTSDCRIFQAQTVPEIVEAVFKDHAAIAKYEFKLVRSYRQRVYCVQYRETDFNFVARLLEDSGIYWYFEHEQGSHKLVLVDAATSHAPMPGETRLPYYENAGQVPPDTEYVTRWHYSHAVKPGKTALTSYDFERPSTKLDVQQVLQREYTYSDQELFDFQGDFTQKDDGQMLADDRLEEQQCRFERLTGTSNAHALATGCLFDLVKHPRDDQNAEYLCLQLQLTARQQPGESGGGPGELACTFAAMHSDQQFRPLRRTPKPFVQGPQTALVVGPAGEEIFTDKYGRVKLQFHWDRYGKKNERSSCWVRVSQPWAGKSWGAISIPRIGQEVIVDFLEGDPDQPIVTGRVYNAENMPPFPLPAAAATSGMKSKSHKAVGFNEISADDTAGKEKLNVHAQFDMSSTVLHDQTLNVTNNRTDSIGVDDSETVGNNQTLKIGVNQKVDIGANRTETVGGAESVTITGHRSETVNAGEDVTVNGSRSHTVNGTQTTTISLAEAHTVGAGRAHTVGGAEAVTIGAAQMVTVGAAQMVSVGGVQKVNVGALQSVSVAGPHKLSAAAIQLSSKGVYKLKAAGIAMVEAPTIVLKAGGSKITMNSSGITIKGAKVNVKADGNVTINGSGGIKLKGPSIGEN